MDYATQSSRVGARVPYSLLKVLRPQLYTTTSWWVHLAMPVDVPLAP